MNKLFALLAVSLVSFVLCATEADVTNTFKEYMGNMTELKVKKALTYLDDSFTETSSDGKVLSLADMKKMLPMFDMVEKVLNGTVAVEDILALQTMMLGQTVDMNDIRARIKQMESTEEGKKMLAQIKSQMTIMTKESIKETKNNVAKAWKTFKVISCKVNGNAAVIIFEMQHPSSGMMEITTTDMIKSNGKWLIKKSVSKTK